MKELTVKLRALRAIGLLDEKHDETEVTLEIGAEVVDRLEDFRTPGETTSQALERLGHAAAGPTLQ